MSTIPQLIPADAPNAHDVFSDAQKFHLPKAPNGQEINGSDDIIRLANAAFNQFDALGALLDPGTRIQIDRTLRQTREELTGERPNRGTTIVGLYSALGLLLSTTRSAPEKNSPLSGSVG